MAQLGPDALDKLLVDLKKEFRAQLVVIRRLHSLVVDDIGEAVSRCEALASRINDLCSQARDDNNNFINPDLEPALDGWLVDDSVIPNLGPISDDYITEIEGAIESLEGAIEGATAAYDSVPRKAFYQVETEDEED